MNALTLILSICTGIFLLFTLSLAHASEDDPLITDDEEYAVFAAVLFQKAPKPAVSSIEPIKNESTFLYSPSLDGIPSNFFKLSRRTSAESLADKKLDRSIVDDFNQKNSTAYQIDPDKFAAIIPKGSSATLIIPKRLSMDDEPGKTKSIRSGTTYISRPGFNKAGTEAVIEVSHVADPEMGIGYQVILKKSPQNGMWSIVDAIINRRY